MYSFVTAQRKERTYGTTYKQCTNSTRTGVVERLDCWLCCHAAHDPIHAGYTAILAEKTAISPAARNDYIGIGPLHKRVPLPTVAQGVLFGLVVWAGSYLGLLPLLGISASGDREPLRRNLMMIAAHTVWGAAMGATANVLFREQG